MRQAETRPVWTDSDGLSALTYEWSQVQGCQGLLVEQEQRERPVQRSGSESQAVNAGFDSDRMQGHSPFTSDQKTERRMYFRFPANPAGVFACGIRLQDQHANAMKLAN
jgi:hypothetical protein